MLGLTKFGTPKIFIPPADRPKCQTPGCDNKGQHTGVYTKNGVPKFRAYCVPCHEKRRTVFKKKIKTLNHKIVPICFLPGCNTKVKVRGTDKKGNIFFNVFCKKHATLLDPKVSTARVAYAAKKAGLSVPEFRRMRLVATAKNAGMTVAQYQANVVKKSAAKLGLSIVDYRNRNHPHRKHRKTYCENKDGRLGYKCRVKIRHSSQLETDHINGNPSIQTKKNLQTLCCLCHRFKTHVFKDYATPGRKALGINT